MFVALMLAVTGTGVGYYFVHFHNIALPWLGSDYTKWLSDSWSFFKETYPLVAGIILISLMTYFIIASAVRRYKFYLSSGQDYRKMISLADSIDDLTNPAQIARLGDYPELQEILRSYGDQINEISEEMGSRESERSIDLEMEVESILAGGEAREELAEGKWWAPLINKVNEHVCSIRTELETTTIQAETGRRTSAQTALTLGRVMESLGGSNEDIIEIARSLGSLNSAVKEIENGPVADSGPAPDTSGAKELISEALDALKTSSRTLHEFSEENNGLALNIALMAARGDISEHDLAQFAEKVRSTAERFNKLGMEMSDIAGKVSDGLAVVGSASGPAGSSIDHRRIASSLEKVSATIEKSNQSLQERITEIGHELDTLNVSVHDAISDERDEDEAAEMKAEEMVIETTSKAGDSDSLVNFGNGVENDVKKDELVLDRSDVWQSGGLLSDEKNEEEEKAVESESLAPGSGVVSFDDDSEEEEISLQAPAEESTRQDEQPVDISELGVEMEESPSGSVAEDKASPATASAPEVASGPQAGEDMMEMPGHKWVKIGMEEGESARGEEDRGAAEAEVAAGAVEEAPETAGPTDEESTEIFMEKVADTIRGMTGIDSPAAAGDDHKVEDSEEEDPIYDLFELGAVEYADQAPGQ